ncbi:3-carboxy-cis,cis-muconate cycloisomerase [Amycolatopsis cihanbeyliensis]|uniref:3-carboxy-cis,cis-muconate cycloisomerase n=1 Tax=Amycolatopsis cihanbeyliensis TaxID=1128664 RepID=A0A542DPU1_AMYCI|nr:3-carboxy-cis,cis-muconate cycloisomerase [Amycolatopsis cihanbeyliensis]TQJ05112.1 3-carboxy-cis,cis-muconate cycloisomerase [Amycolatopsis cihanbeyliensis]
MAVDHGLLAPAWAATGSADLVDDLAVLRAMVEVEVALARAQAELGVVPGSAVRAIEAAAGADTFDLPALAEGVRDTANPVVAFVGQFTAAVAEVDAEAAEYVHRGSTSQDILDTALMLVCRSVLERVGADLEDCAASLAGLARRHRDTPMVARTLTQHAVPTTFGLKAAGWLSGVLAAGERVDAARRSLPVSLGGAGGTLAAYEQYAVLHGVPGSTVALPGALARRLGLAEPTLPWHGMRAPLADVAAALSVVTGTLGKLAADVLVLGRTEVGEVAEPTEPGRGASSAMPQKRNPVFATLITTAARQLPPLAQVLFQSMSAEDERSAGGWHAEWQPLREALRSTAGASRNAALLLDGLRVFPERMAANLSATGGAVVSERLSAVLAGRIGKGPAKRLLTEATAADGPLAEAVAAHPALAGHELPAEEVAALLDPTGYPGIAAELVDRALAGYRSRTPPAGG